jgi:hypothetical protein
MTHEWYHLISLPIEYTECQAFSPVVRTGSPPPHSQASVAPPSLWVQGGDTLVCLGGGQTLWYSIL